MVAIGVRWYTKRDKRIEAGNKLLESFDSTKEAISKYNGQFYLLVQHLVIDFKTQKVIAREFRKHLGLINRCRFNKAWNEYYGGDEDDPDFLQYMSNDVHNLLLKRIGKILKFTK
ncbi:MAG: hypothetical protein HY879_10795 [Deltaproteobacteria bacterium]|nr:hypothetical protein [Deltaproteobacteria bacterium]